MHKNKEKQIIYYTDELNDDFGGKVEKQKVIDSNFKFIHKNIFWRFFECIAFYPIVVPVFWFYTRVIRGIKFVNKKNIKKVKGKNYFLFGNHTGFYDGFIPNLISLPKRTKIIVSPHAVSIRGIKNFIQMLGAYPLPTGLNGMHKFVEGINYYNKHDWNITIYPEAHIWPYYTKIRPFKDNSFGYPVSTNSPVFAFCTTFSKPTGLFKKARKANIKVYISEPFYPNLDVPKKQAQKELRDKVYNFMTETAAKYSDYEVITYLPAYETINIENNNQNEK